MLRYGRNAARASGARVPIRSSLFFLKEAIRIVPNGRALTYAESLFKRVTWSGNADRKVWRNLEHFFPAGNDNTRGRY